MEKASLEAEALAEEKEEAEDTGEAKVESGEKSIVSNLRM